MGDGVRTRIWIESVLAVATGLLAVVTVVNAEWIEWLFGVDPDRGSGALEWGMVCLLAVCSVVAFILARRDVRRLRTAGGLT
jgi:hypothetical protein